MGTSLIQIGTPLPRGCLGGSARERGVSQLRRALKPGAVRKYRLFDGFKNRRSPLILLANSLLEHSVGPIAQRGEQTQYNRESASVPPNPVCSTNQKEFCQTRASYSGCAIRWSHQTRRSLATTFRILPSRDRKLSAQSNDRTRSNVVRAN
jgi:hypothetical protein